MAKSPEFSHLVDLDSLGSDKPLRVTLEADAQARAALARRFEIDAVEALKAKLTLARARGEITLTGTLTARVVQPCVVTLDPVTTALETDLDIRLIPEEAAIREVPDEDDNVTLEEGGPEIEVIGAEGVDLGEIVAQSLALNLPEYPRVPNVAFSARSYTDKGAAPVDDLPDPDEDNPKQRPFAGLKDLLKK